MTFPRQGEAKRGVGGGRRYPPLVQDRVPKLPPASSQSSSGSLPPLQGFFVLMSDSQPSISFRFQHFSPELSFLCHVVQKRKTLFYFWLFILITSPISSYRICSNHLSKFDSLTLCDLVVQETVIIQFISVLSVIVYTKKCMWVSTVFEFKVHLHVDPFSRAMCTFEQRI